MKHLPSILIIEDDGLLQETYSDQIADSLTIHAATSLEQAEFLFDRYQNRLAAIIVDACVPGNVPNTMPLVRRMRDAGFHGPIIATSSVPEYQEELMQAGCSHRCNKKDVIALLRSLF